MWLCWCQSAWFVSDGAEFVHELTLRDGHPETGMRGFVGFSPERQAQGLNRQ